LPEALDLARQAVREFPCSWHAFYAFGQCLRFSGDVPGAIEALARANQLRPREPGTLLALGIARQLNGEHHLAISAFREAVEIDPDFVLAINSLAMTQKLMGEYEKADHNYCVALKALARAIVKRWHNSPGNHRVGNPQFSLWAEHAMFAALWLAAHESMEGIACSTPEMALRDAETGYLQGWYWSDIKDHEGKNFPLYYPNFFNSFHDELRKSGIYKVLVGNRSTVLSLLGRAEEAEVHLQEAIEFST
jgi:tetratricopeptide (TPR) repeat protein